MQGFFAKGDLRSAAPPSLVPKCGACGLYKLCRSPKMPVYGKGRRGVLVVGEAPGEHEDRQGTPFVGKAGQYLQARLDRLGVSLRHDCWVTNALICRPPDNKVTNEKAVEYCRPNLLKAVRELRPRVVLLLGKRAIQSLVGHLWREGVSKVEPWLGWQIPDRSLGAWVCPTWHPSFLLRAEGKDNEIVERFFDQHLKAAFEIDSRPWPGGAPPLDVRCELDPDGAASLLRVFMAKDPKTISFDYETTTLKPDGPHARIVCCAVSDGVTTLAYPWHGAARLATQEILRSPVPKVGANIKFEERWTRKEFGHGVRNWAFDTTLAAHVLDNRPDITSVKFQAFVRLGVGDWGAGVSPFLAARRGGGNEPNRITEVGLPALLKYCGTDALVEFQLAALQTKEIAE